MNLTTSIFKVDLVLFFSILSLCLTPLLLPSIGHDEAMMKETTENVQ